jgi:hypothetical protein
VTPGQHISAQSRSSPAATAGSTGIRSVLALQRAAGNRTVSQLLAHPAAEADAIGTGAVSGPSADGATSARWGAPSTPTPANLFGREAERPRRADPFEGQAQFYTTTDSVLTNLGSVLGLGGRTAALTGAVTFDSNGFSASVAPPLRITTTGSDLKLDSQLYSATGTVKASGPKARVGAYEIGFLQTVYEASMNFYYEPPSYAPNLFARVAPTLFGVRKKMAIMLPTTPVRDGDAGKRPWYGMETVLPFDMADPSTKTSTMTDHPNITMGWTVGSPPDEQHLVKTDGHNRFRSWLAVKDTSSATAIPLNYADWEVDWGTTVAFNKASPAASVVTPTATSGSQTTATGDGAGGKWPIHGDPVANDKFTPVTTLW